MKVLTKRQEKIWSDKMLGLEERMLAYCARDPTPPDGSFMMSAFKEGYYLRQREESSAKRERGNPRTGKLTSEERQKKKTVQK
jgi:hypothetical protein